jgi:Bacterial extracellular solute-binding proteins, family 5 Middle
MALMAIKPPGRGRAIISKIVATLAGLVVASVFTGPAAAENVLRWASAISGLTFDPHAFNHQPTRAQTMQVYEPLVDFDSDHSITPSLAVAWRPIDSTTWEFELRQGVRFHDGTPLTAEDVVFSLRRALSPKSEFGRAVPPLAAVEAAGDHVVRVRTVAPDPGKQTPRLIQGAERALAHELLRLSKRLLVLGISQGVPGLGFISLQVQYDRHDAFTRNFAAYAAKIRRVYTNLA